VSLSLSVSLSRSAHITTEYKSKEQEAPAILPHRPAADWPTRGDVSFSNVYMKYEREIEKKRER
jgi:hypothetical protein